MTLTEEQKKEIYRLSDIGMSQNNIAQQTGINKAYVNACLRQRKALSGAEQLNLNLPVNTHQQPVNNFGLSHESAALTGELVYTKKYLEDLEDRNRALKNELNSISSELHKINKLYNELLIDFNTQEKRHQLELEKRDSEYQRNNKTGLNGLLSGEGILGKMLDKTEVQMAIVNRLLGAQNIQSQNPGTQIFHPEISDPTVARQINEIIQAFAVFPKASINELYDLIALFAQFPALLTSTAEQVKSFVKNQNQNSN